MCDTIFLHCIRQCKICEGNEECMMNHSGTKVLETNRLILRRFSENDAMQMYTNWASNKNVTKYLMWETHKDLEVSKSIIQEWVNSYENNNFYQWAIELKRDKKVIGSIGVVEQDDITQMMHVGYCIGEEWWHKGITSEALDGVIKYLFCKTNVNRIESRHDPRNIYSGKVMEKCGMIYEGTHRSADWNNQGICDASYYAILRDEYS